MLGLKQAHLDAIPSAYRRDEYRLPRIPNRIPRMPRHDRGLYEVLITEALAASLRELGERLEARSSELRTAEAADRIALHLSRVVQRAIASLDDDERVASSIALARKLIQQIEAAIDGSGAAREAPIAPGRVLRAISARLPDGICGEHPGAAHPAARHDSADQRAGRAARRQPAPHRDPFGRPHRRRHGLHPPQRHRSAARRAPRALRRGPAASASSRRPTRARPRPARSTRFASSAPTCGSRTTPTHHAPPREGLALPPPLRLLDRVHRLSNLTHSAQVSGLEWNVRVSGARNPDVVDKVAAVFESYWNSGDFVPYDRDEFLARTTQAERVRRAILLSPIELRPEPFQERLLEQIALSRERGHHRNLLVSATGTGKTVMAALDYARLRETLPRARLLFVAHREEILDQSLATFRHGLRDHAFGELWVGGQRPRASSTSSRRSRA